MVFWRMEEACELRNEAIVMKRGRATAWKIATLERKDENEERSSATTHRTRHQVQCFRYFTDVTDYGAVDRSSTGNKEPGIITGKLDA